MIATEQSIVNLTQNYLEPHQSTEYRLDVLPEGIKKDGDWWYLVVRPSRSDIRSSDYYARLEATEEDIEKNEHTKVLLVPVLPGD